MNSKTVATRLSGILVIGLASFGLEGRAAAPPELPVATASRPGSPPGLAAFGLAMPICFEANLGQANSETKFLARGLGYSLFLTLDGARLSFAAARPAQAQAMSDDHFAAVGAEASSIFLQVRLLGANPAATLGGKGPMVAKANYFLGQQPGNWRTGVPTYAQIRCAAIYPGVDLVYYGWRGQLEYDFTVAPGADPCQIRFAFEGADQLELDDQGDLLVHFGGAVLRHHRPVVYQTIKGLRHLISARFAFYDAPGRPLTDPASRFPRSLRGSRAQVGFNLGHYDPTQPLLIDPVLSFATYLGGSGEDAAYGVAVDRQGNIYVTGQTTSADFPSVNPHQPKLGGSHDVFVTKLTANGDAVVYSTYLGGSGHDSGFHIVVDEAGSAVVAGTTYSTNFPTVNAQQAAYGGGKDDGFVAKLSPDGAGLIYSTYLGGSGSDEIASAAMDGAGNVYVVGRTSSTNLPTANALQASQGASLRDGFNVLLAKLAPDGSLAFSTYLGGSGNDCATSCDLDTATNLYVTGYTSSTNFPTVTPRQPQLAGGYDAFVCKLNAAGSALVYSTFLGGTAQDAGRSIAVDRAGNAYICGDTYSTDFPLSGALQSTNAGNRDLFICKLNPAGSALLYSTYLGGSGDELAGLAIAPSGSVYLAGLTSSTNFPTANAPQPNYAGGPWDAFFAKLSPAGTNLLYSTFIGGEGSDQVSALALDGAGGIYLAGATSSTNFPVAKAFQSRHRGGKSDAFLIQILDPPAPAGKGQPTAPTSAVPTETPGPGTVTVAAAPGESRATNQPPAEVSPAQTGTKGEGPTLLGPPIPTPPKLTPPSQSVPAVTNEPTPPPATKPTAVEPAEVKSGAANVQVTEPTTNLTATTQPSPAAKPAEAPTAPPETAVTNLTTATTPAVQPAATPAPTNAPAETNQPAVAPAAALVTTTTASLFDTNLLTNGDAEAGEASPSIYATVGIPGWTVTNKMTVLHYGTPGGFPTTNDIPANPGQNLFVGGPDDALSAATQAVDTTWASTAVDAGQVTYTLSACLGGTSGQRDHAAVQALFKDGEGAILGQAILGPVTPEDREYKTKLLLRTASGTLPAHTRSVAVRLEMTRRDGNYNDAFADNLSLVLHK